MPATEVDNGGVWSTQDPPPSPPPPPPPNRGEMQRRLCLHSPSGRIMSLLCQPKKSRGFNGLLPLPLAPEIAFEQRKHGSLVQFPFTPDLTVCLVEVSFFLLPNTNFKRDFVAPLAILSKPCLGSVSQESYHRHLVKAVVRQCIWRKRLSKLGEKQNRREQIRLLPTPPHSFSIQLPSFSAPGDA